jgi:hypothetical protein
MPDAENPAAAFDIDADAVREDNDPPREDRDKAEGEEEDRPDETK